MKFTHKGWFGFCPVYLADTFSGNPIVVPRHGYLRPLLDLAIAVQEISIGVCTLMNPHWEPMWKIRLTGKR